ncbi:MAG TPA: helix-hairpin-helix domain-containing protein [Aequorivita sp.]|nr:helix-hairpin-helix domain-containing protein [Aequorivita sp.]
MANFKSHFAFNRSQRNGIFLLVLIIIILQLVYFFVDFSSEEDISPQQKQQISQFQQEMDSLKRIASEEKKEQIFPFNPNYIADFKGYTLGMSVEEIDRLLAYRKAGKWINSAEDFQKVTGVSDSLLNEISPYFQFPEWVNNSKTTYPKRANSEVISETRIDLNEVTAEQLKNISGIGDILSERIIKYRNSLGGFKNNLQLYDVYGLSPEVAEKVLQKFPLQDAGAIEKKDLNSISVLELSEMPFFDYELARKVIEYRKLRGGIKNFEELAKIKGFPSEKIDRIKLYLSIDQK